MSRARDLAAFVSNADGDIKFDTDTLFIDSSANRVGIGTSSPAYNFQLSNTSGDANLGITASTTGLSQILFTDGAIAGKVAYRHSTNAIEFTTNGSEAMRIDENGKVGIGTTSPARPFSVTDTTGDGTGGMILASYLPTLEMDDISGGGTSFILQHDTTNTIFKHDTTERMRIDGSGNLLVGKTSATGSNSDGFEVRSGGFFYAVANGSGSVIGRSGTTGTALFFRYNGTTVGSVSVTGSSTAYNTSSDYRLKEDVQPMTGASDRVLALNPVNFAWKADGSRVDGFLAHEAQAVVPEAVTGSKDAMRDEEYEVTPAVYEDVVIPAVEEQLDEEGNVIVEAQPERTEQRLVSEAVMGTRSVPDYQGIDQAKLVPLLTAALQEAIAKIETLETKVAALESA